MARDINQENHRHEAGWAGVVRFIMAASADVGLALILMAAFLL